MEDNEAPTLTMRRPPKPVIEQPQVMQDDFFEQDLDENTYLAQRDQQIDALHKDMSVVHELMGRLGEIVENDQVKFDNIEVNIRAASGGVKTGTNELKKAAKSQEDSRQTTAIVTGVGITAAVGVVLALLFGLKN